VTISKRQFDAEWDEYVKANYEINEREVYAVSDKCITDYLKDCLPTEEYTEDCYGQRVYTLVSPKNIGKCDCKKFSERGPGFLGEESKYKYREK